MRPENTNYACGSSAVRAGRNWSLIATLRASCLAAEPRT